MNINEKLLIVSRKLMNIKLAKVIDIKDKKMEKKLKEVFAQLKRGKDVDLGFLDNGGEDE